MLGLILIGLGAISLTATAAAIYVDGETEEERERQQDLRKRHEQYRLKVQEERQAVLAPLLAEYRADAVNKLETRETVTKEFQRVIAELDKQLCDDQFTPARRAALFSLRQRFEKNKQKIESFNAYLREYIRALDGAEEVPPPPGSPLAMLILVQYWSFLVVTLKSFLDVELNRGSIYSSLIVLC
jgi:hypothetical protein